MGSGTQGPARQLGRVIGGYRLEAVLGEGGTGVVYRGGRVDGAWGIDERTAVAAVELPPVAAIKLLVIPWNLNEAAAAEQRKRFLREIEILRALKHPHILPIITDGVDDETDSLYMILPYLPGGSLGKRLSSGPARMPLDEVERLLEQIASAMDYAYTRDPNRRIVHRDIKPDNILLSDAGQAYLADFSIARMIDESRTQLTHTGANPGTFAYMSPEARLGEANSGLASDIYSLGMVVYEMVAGKRDTVSGDLPSPRTLNPDLPVPAAEVILRALRRDPAERFATATAFAQAFSCGLRGEWPAGMEPRVADGGAPPTPTDAGAQTAPDSYPLSQPIRSARSRRMVALLGGAVALLLVAGIIGMSVLGHSVFFAAAQPGNGSSGGGETHAHAATASVARTTAPGSGSTTSAHATATAKKSGSAAAGPTSASGTSPGSSPGSTPASTGASAPTATPAGPLQDGASFVTQSSYPTVNPGAGVSIYFVMSNSGGTTWSSSGGYSLICTSTCLSGQNQSVSGSVGPGQQYQFNIALTAPVPDYGQTYRTWWSMARNGQTFGPLLYIDVTVRGWHSWYSVHRPACDDTSAWADVNKAATRDCSSSSGLVLSQYSNTSWAELDLNTPNGQQYYSQNNLRLKVQGAFLNPSDTSVWATVVDQTPQGGSCGGYLLAVNSQGNWKLQQTSGACGVSTVASGQIGGFNAGGFSMEVDVLNGSLSGVIDGQTVVSGRSDGLNPSPGAEGLMEESSVATSSAILYHDFELDSWS